MFERQDEAVAFITQTFQTLGPFDGVLAFSQGASFLSLLCALRKGEGRPQAVEAIDFDFAVVISGFRALGKDKASVYDTQFQVPSLHIYGSTDNVVPFEVSKRLTESYANKTVVEHTGGHFVPWPGADTPERKAIVAFFDERLTAKQQKEK
eukprot:m.46799 g.46799  ORF g.46799 m.46799 type:complete len:151 (+) comp12576_c0_seq1:491-943(+)